MVNLLKIPYAAVCSRFAEANYRFRASNSNGPVGQDLNWYVDKDCDLWTDDAFEFHGHNFTCLTNGAKCDLSIEQVNVVR